MYCPRCKSENIREIEVPPYIPDDTKPHNKSKMNLSRTIGYPNLITLNQV